MPAGLDPSAISSANSFWLPVRVFAPAPDPRPGDQGICRDVMVDASRSWSPFRFGPSAVADLAKRLPCHDMDAGGVPNVGSRPGDARDSLRAGRGVCLLVTGFARQPSFAPSGGRRVASAAYGDAGRSPALAGDLWVAVEAAGIEEDFARLGEERLRPQALIPMFENSEGARSVAACAIASGDTDPKATVARPPIKWLRALRGLLCSRAP